MKYNFFILTLILGFHLTLFSADKPYIISGFDDVLRQAENTSLLKVAIKIFEDDKTFSGMPELYKLITKDQSSPKFVVVSAISNFFDTRIDSFLNQTNYPHNKRYLRNWFTQWSISNFKIEKITEILQEKPSQKFIVIFDNSDASLALAQTLESLFPHRILAIYLRQVVNKNTPANAIPFFTAFDIAINEYKSGRMTQKEIHEVAKSIINEKNVEMIFPAYALCPHKYNPCNSIDTDLIQICNELRTHVNILCQNRQ